MLNILLPALAAAAILSSGALATGARLVTREMSSSIRSVAELPVRSAGVVCGNGGCAPAQTSAPRRRRFVPLGRG